MDVEKTRTGGNSVLDTLLTVELLTSVLIFEL